MIYHEFHDFFLQGTLKTYSTGYVDGILTFVNLTNQLGQFTPCVLIYYPNLEEIDVSGCVTIDPTLFADCIGACKQLKKLIMTGCRQFSQYSFVKMMGTVKSIVYLDISNTSEIEYCSAYAILSNLQKIERINFDPADISTRLNDFKHLLALFHNVHFGVNVVRFFPFSRVTMQCNEM